MNEMTELVLQDAAEKMTKAVQHARAEFASVRTGRANSALVEKLVVEAYGVEMRLQELASFSIPEARQLVITPHDQGTMGAIEKAIRSSDLGLNPSSDGTNIRLNFPPLTADRRKEFVKVVKQMAEDGRIAVRQLRRAARHDLDSLQKDSELSEDELQRAEKELDKITHSQEAGIDQALESKEQELLQD